MIDDRCRIVATEHDPRSSEHLGVFPGGVKGLVGERGKLGEPATQIGAIWVEALRLAHRVEDPKVGLGVGP
jgi:hypothetical protein